jgi:hypothetical protein
MRKILLTAFAAAAVLSAGSLGKTAAAMTVATPSQISGASESSGSVNKASLCCDWFGYFACWRYPDHYRHYRAYRYGWRCW